MGFLQGLVVDIPDNFQSSIQEGEDGFEEPKAKKRRKTATPSDNLPYVMSYFRTYVVQ